MARNPLIRKAFEEAAKREIEKLPKEENIIRPYSDEFNEKMEELLRVKESSPKRKFRFGRIAAVAAVLAVMLTIIMLVLKKVTPPIVLEESLKPEKDHLSSQDLNYLVGREGVASTDLRPSGKCKIDGVEFDVRTEGSYIVKNTWVIIRNIRNNTIIVAEK